MKLRKIEGLPLTPDDLRRLADLVEEIDNSLPEGWDDDETSWVWGLLVKVVDPDLGELFEGTIEVREGYIGFLPDGWV